MKLFRYEQYKVTISEEALALKPFKKLWDRDKTKNKDKAILNAFRVNNSGGLGFTPKKPSNPSTIDMKAKYECPLYAVKKSNPYNNINGNFMWLFGR